MKGKYYTIMVFPDMIGKPRKIILSKFLVQTFTTLFSFFIVCFIVASIVFTHRYIEISKDAVNVELLRKEASVQKAQIEKFTRRLKDFEVQMVRLERFDKKLRIITSLEDSGNSFQKAWGVGGADKEISNGFYSPSKDFDNNVIKGMYEDLRHFKLQAELQEISFQELDEFFKDQTSLLSATPSIWPTKGWVTSRFGYRKSPFTGLREMHKGMDIATRINSPVTSPADGVVIRTGRDYGFGNVLEIDHGYGIVTRYGHNSKHLIKVGDRIKRGQLIALVGNTGRSTGSHLHYEVIVNGVQVDPLRYIMDNNLDYY
ncbi:MAG: M23 family metallopeptidase [Nitrospinota bacterium]